MIARFNPLSRIAGLMALCTPLLLSVDIVSAAVSLAVTLIASPMLGVGLAQPISAYRAKIYRHKRL